MAVPRATGTLGRTVLRRAATQNRTQAWRQIGRRNYASEHGQKSSELPWIIGSVGFTAPAAVWLYSQGPQKGGHHAEEAHEEGGEEEKDQGESGEEAPEEDSKQEDKSKQEDSGSEDSDSDDSKEGDSDKGSEQSSDEGKAEKKSGDDKESKEGGEAKEEKKGGDDKEDKKEGGGEDKSSKGGDKKQPERKFSDDGYELPGPNAPGQINYKPGMGKGPGEQQKGERKPTEKKGDKDSQSDYSGAQNPYLDDDEKSKKGEGLKETQKIHGTVDSRRPARGDGKPNEDE